MNNPGEPAAAARSSCVRSPIRSRSASSPWRPGTLLVSALQLEWLAPSDGSKVALILIAFVFPLQLLTSIFSYLARDVVAGTGMGALSGTWLRSD